MLKQILQNRLTPIHLVYLLIISAVAYRLLPYYIHLPHGKLVVGLLTAYTLLFLSYPFFIRLLGPNYIHLYIIINMGITLVLLVGIPSYSGPQDFFAILIAPLCMLAMWYLPQSLGAAWVAFLSITTSALAIIIYRRYEGNWEGIGLSLAYCAVFILVAVFSSVTRRADEDRDRARALLAELQVANSRLEEYSHQAEKLAAVEERSRLARELHDSVSQTIFSMTMTAQAAKVMLDRDVTKVPEQLDRLQTLSRNALAEMRTLIQQTKPLVNSENLAEMLKRHIAEREKLDGITIRSEFRGARRLPDSVESGWFRVAQEAINNIVKYAGVKHAYLALDLESDPPYLMIKDEGCGFDIDQLSSDGNHMGLNGMRDRVEALGGTLTVASAVGKGTLIRVDGFQLEEGKHE